MAVRSATATNSTPVFDAKSMQPGGETGKGHGISLQVWCWVPGLGVDIPTEPRGLRVNMSAELYQCYYVRYLILKLHEAYGSMILALVQAPVL